MSKISLSLAAAAALTHDSGSAATVPLNASPGLWQITTQSQLSGQMPMIDESAINNLPPARRAKFEAAMKTAMAKAAGPHVFKECLTREKLAKGFDLAKPDPSCTRTVVTSSANALEVREQCTTARDSRVGDYRFTLANQTTAMGSVQMQMSHAGKTMTINGTMQGQWLSSDCGKLKDVVMVK